MYLDIALTAALAASASPSSSQTSARRTVKRVVPQRASPLRLAETEFAIAMTLLFALSLLAVYAGVAAIVGAFLAGMALRKPPTDRVHDLTNGVAELLRAVLPGRHRPALRSLRLRPAPARSRSPALVVVPPSSPNSSAAAWALCRMGRTDAIRVGVGMVPRGEVGMVVAQIGLNLGVMAESVYGIIVFMSVATTLIAPPLLKLAFRAPTEAEREIVRLG